MPYVSGRLGLDQPATYEIRVYGKVEDGWADRIEDGLRISLHTVAVQSGVTTVRSTVADQSALFGLLNRVRDLSLTLLSVSCIRAKRSPA
jgi:hypothetical protein